MHHTQMVQQWELAAVSANSKQSLDIAAARERYHQEQIDRILYPERLQQEQTKGIGDAHLELFLRLKEEEEQRLASKKDVIKGTGPSNKAKARQQPIR
jgi:uncharacterized protein with von Willebrand factor type A (vWA) domain